MTTAVQATQQTPATSTVAEPMPVKPSRDQVIHAIMEETGCNKQLAKRTIGYVNGFVERARAQKYETVYPREYELNDTPYDVVDVIMPHGQTAQPDSAHDLLERHLLDPAKDEFSLVHDMSNEDGERRRYCTVTVSLAKLN